MYFRSLSVRCLSVLPFMALVACGGDSAAIERAQVNLAANASAATTLALASGASLMIPAGSSAVPITIVIESAPAARRAAHLGAIVATPIVLSPEGTMFDKVLELTIPISPVNLPAGRSIDDVVVVTAPHGSDVFVPLPTRRSGNAVIASTPHFSDFFAIVPDVPFDGGVDAQIAPMDSGVDAGVAFDAGDDAGAALDAGPAPDASMPVDAGGMSDAGTLPPPNGMRHVFVTLATPNGNLGGTAGADTLCMADPRRPTLGTFKAVIGSSSRYACDLANCAATSSSLDWVLLPNTAYFMGAFGAESSFAMTDTNGLFIFPTSMLGTGFNFWLGLNTDWTNNANNCANWGDGTTGSSGSVGWDAATDSALLAGGMVGCGTYEPLLCVEQ